MTKVAEAEAFVIQAEKILNPSLIKRLFGEVNKSDASELFVRAARLYKLTGDSQKAVECHRRAEGCADSNHLPLLQKETLELILRFGLEEYIDLYTQLVSDGYVSDGYFSQAYKTFEKVALFYDTRGLSDKALHYAEKAVEISKCEKVSCFKAYSILVRNLLVLKKFDEALKACKAYLETECEIRALEIYNKREISFLASLLIELLDLSKETLSNFNQTYLDSYQTEILKALREQDLDAFEEAIHRLDSVKKFTKEQTILCLALKERITHPSYA